MCYSILFFLGLISIRQLAMAQTQSPYAYATANWTSCDEFLNNTEFNAISVLDVDWKIFYFWNPETEESYNIKFSKPSKVLVNRFKVELDKELKPPVNWTDAELFMETSIDFSALFLKAGRSGLYRVIPSAAFDYSSVPYLVFGMKLVEPGYLGIANCKHRICYALAPADKLPFHYELEKAASTLKFYSHFNRSHIDSTLSPDPSTRQIPFVHDLPDDEEDEDLEVEQDSGKVEFL